MRRGIKEFGALMELFPILTGDMVTRCMHLSKFNFVLKLCKYLYMGFPGDSMVKNLPAIAGDMGSIPGWGRSSGEGNGNTLQYPCLENPMDRGAWRAMVHGVTKESDTSSLLHNDNVSLKLK